MAETPDFGAGETEPVKAGRPGFRRVALRRGIPIALGGLIVTTVGTGWAMVDNTGPDYRTAMATIGTVDQLANFTGTVATTGRASAAFGVAGTVEKVSVAAGDKVAKGDVLATLGKEDLKAAVRAAQATLAEAQASLASDSASSSSSSSSSSGTSGSSGSSGAPSSGGSNGSGANSGGSTTGGSGSGGSGAGTPSGGTPSGGTPSGGTDSPPGGGSFQVNLTPQVEAVNAARKHADLALAIAGEAMTTQAAACAAVLSGDDQPEAAPTTPAATRADSGVSDAPSGDTSNDSRSSDDADHQSLLDCVDALKTVQTAQATVAAAQAAVDTADGAFTTAMNDAVKQLVADAEAAATQAKEAANQAAKEATEQATAAAKAAAEKAAAGQAAAEQAVSSRPGVAAGSTGTSAAEKTARIAVDEAAVSSAEAALASAQDDLEDAVLRAPVAGVVGDVPFTAGQASSASDAISLLGTDAVEVTINVPLTTADALTKGLAASVTADGAEEPTAGAVNTIGVLPDSSSGTATYPVTILVPQPSSALAQGAAAAVSLTLKSATDVITVPNSALSPTGTGSTSFVTLIQDGKPVRRTVTTAAVGETRTAVSEGLAEGDTVVLADASADVPASSTTSTRTGVGGGGLGGGGATFAIPSGGASFSGGGTRR